MDNTVLKEYERLNANGQTFVNAAIYAATNNPSYLSETSEEEMQEIKRKNEEAEREKRIEDEKNHQYFEELKAESENYTEQDYISKLNELFSKMPWYRLRYFYLFINAKLHYDEEACQK